MIALAIIAGLASILCTGIAIGTCIHRTNPTTERPIRTVKLRGELVDIVLFGPPPAQACTAPSAKAQLGGRVPPKTRTRADLETIAERSISVPVSRA